jgi:predicted alpha/beta-hydrolase family hydrolase
LKPDVTIAWDRPTGAERAILLLAHGAGGDLNDPLLRAVGNGLAENGIAVARFNFPYREAGRRAPGSQVQSEECFRNVASAARKDGVPLFCGGKSYGGRIASHIASEGYEMRGLVLLSYPLHPPGKPERLRDGHLRQIGAPMLFVQGTKDPFARPDLLTSTIKRLRNANLVQIEGGDHSLRVKAKPAATIYAEITAAAALFIQKS